MHNVLLWIDPTDCDPPHGLDMEGERDRIKVYSLMDAFLHEGFNLNCAALVGYPLNGRIQLLSGTHRHRAALMAGTKLPVTLWLRSYVEAMWGTEDWLKLIEDIPVKNLLSYDMKDDSWADVQNREPFSPDEMYMTKE